ncbi:gliding motility-associated C-terminal domain-containing protein (plasmid) [Bernardetia sp. Wsw4-3y2]|uniref:T9SS type B sorting domain-containing protein n=1 Tax=Bernardetia sp. Wsw4-3y2 TaxID=3127471 RepID=UPI0030CF3887
MILNKFIFFIVTLLFLSFIVQEKIFAQEANFTFQNGTTGCVPFTVEVIDNSGADPSLISYKFGDAPVQKGTDFTFITPGIYSVTQFISGGSSVSKTNIIKVLSREPVDFDVISCVGRRVKVQIRDFYYDAYRVNFGNNRVVEVERNGFAEHTYPNENEYMITVNGFFDESSENCIGTERLVRPINQLVPAVINRLEALTNTTAKIDYTLNTNLPHKLEKMTPSGFERVGSLLEGSSSHIIQNVSFSDIYRISVEDDCQSSTETSSIVYVPDVNVAVEENHVNIHWELRSELDDDTFLKYVVYRNDELLYETSDSTLTYLKDEQVACQVRYCYQVETQYKSGLKVLSSKRCVLAQSNIPPPAVSDIYATFTPTNQIALNWNYPNGITTSSINELNFMRIDKNEISQSYSLNSSTANFEDSQVDISKTPYCYAISYVSSCKLSAGFSNFVCPIILSYEGNPTDKKGNIIFDWTMFRGVPTNNYVLEQLDSLGKTPFNIQNVFSSSTHSIVIENQTNQTSYFRVRANLGDTVTYSNTVRIDFPSFINLPNVFTPNGDNLNDTYGIESRFIEEFEMMIFNKWGESVFQSNDPTARWDGRYRNGFAPSGEYTLKIVATDQRGRKYILTEIIKLLR